MISRELCILPRAFKEIVRERDGVSLVWTAEGMSCSWMKSQNTAEMKNGDKREMGGEEDSVGTRVFRQKECGVSWDGSSVF